MSDKEKLESLKEHRDKYSILKGEIGDWIIEQCEKVERYEQALKFYAKYSNYNYEIAIDGWPERYKGTPVSNDDGKIAREALREASDNVKR